ncbi:uncharacterized protein LOC132645206 [Lycium barbarum]|uniref:uncharacterized protein LOC132645206 n=1 Tax=Lycium barbarum TaxID=112863 RepID=UPI00293E66F3|nr:uncharacterized protein LOC132645206 [Lycium barbarum]XP_060218036.1 uncharacterized protein LOC132645206 [Lycium barbarum]XP_060218037.1 uncharacterized protein LOC132645206 [Lycium barbarum]XP_060218038.1 uncharacterized protein LOC132645206 [Lycium barbarum]
MMATEDKTLFCYCHWGWKKKVLPDGSTSYVGGITRQVTVKIGIEYNDFVKAVFDRLGIINPSDKRLQFTAKFNSQLIDLKDQNDVNALFQYNDGFADIYASSLEKKPYSRQTSGGAKKVDDENDNKCGVLSKVSVAKQPPHQVNGNPFVRQNNIQNGSNAQFSNLNPHQSTQATSSAMQETFWTKCHTCKIRFQYYSNYVNRALRCKICLKTFIAYDLGSQGAAETPKQSQPAGQKLLPNQSNVKSPFEQKELPKQGTSKMTASSAGFPPTQIGSPQSPEICRGKIAPVFVDIRTKQKDEKYEKLMGGMREGAAMPKVDGESRKRSWKQTVESSVSDDTSVRVETNDVGIENRNNPPAGQGTGLDGYDARRSSQHWQHVSNNKGVIVDVNDLASPLKKAWSNRSAGDSKPLKRASAHLSAGESKSQQKEAICGDDQKHVGVTRSCSNSME